MAEVTCCNPTDHEILLALLETENQVFERLEQVIQAISGSAVVNPSGAFTDRSGTITLGGTAQTIAVAQATRKTFIFENLSSESLWVNFGIAAVQNQPSFEVLPKGTLRLTSEFISTELISVIGATTGSAFTAKEAI